MPPKQQQTQNRNNTLFYDGFTFAVGTVAAIVIAPITLPALSTLGAAGGVGTIFLGGRRLLARGLLAIRRERQYDPEVENIHQNRRLSPPAEFQNNDNNFEDNQNHIAFVADNFSPSDLITTQALFIRHFQDRLAADITPNPLIDKSALTRTLKKSLGNERLARILHNMIREGYNSRRDTKAAAKLIWAIKEGTKTLDVLSNEEKELLKIALARAGADVPWWPDNDDDDNDPASSAATAYDDNDDDNPGAGSISYVMDNNDDDDDNAPALTAGTEHTDNDDNHPGAEYISYAIDNSENQNISTLKPELDTNIVNVYINATTCNDTTFTNSIYTTIVDDVLTKYIPLSGHLAIASEV